MSDVITVGAGSIATQLPPGQTGPTDSVGDKPVAPRLTDDFQGPPPSNSVFTSIAYPQFNTFSAAMTTDPLTVQTEAHGLDIGYSNTPVITAEDYSYPYFADLTVGLDGLNADGTKLAAHTDWAATADWDGQMRATFGEGLPFVYVRKASDADAVVDLHEQSAASKDAPLNPLTYTLSGLTGTFNGGDLHFNLPVNAGAHVADGVQFRVSYDFDGDGKTDRVETYDWFATDAAGNTVENYNDGNGKLHSATGAPMADLKNGSVKVEVWKAMGTGDIAVGTNSADSYVDLPFSGLSSAAAGGIDGALYLQGGAKPGGAASTLAAVPGATPATDSTHMEPLPSIGGYAGPGQVWYNENGVVGITINGKSYGIFGPTGSTWTYTAEGLKSNLDGKDYYSVAVLPDSSVGTLMMFRQHAYAFVTDTKTSYEIDKATGTVTTKFEAATQLMENDPSLSSDPLMALYRHQYIHSDATLSDKSYASARGEIKLLSGGSTFSTTMQLAPILPILPFLGTDAQKSELQMMLHDELKGLLEQDNSPMAGDTYWASRQCAKYADLALLAQQVGYGQARDVFLGAVEKQLETWFNASDGDQYQFYYDKTWGTLIGFPASYNSNDKLNDHHFHYGYIINAAATIAQLDPTWAAQSKWGAMVNQLIADVANWDRTNNDYTYLRTFDPYAGHSWASGTGVGTNQESASEALNFASAVARWGAVTGQKDVEDLGLYLHTTESEAMAQYWFDVDHAVFPDGYDHAQIGIVEGNDGKYTTFFGTKPDWVQGINFTPMNGGSLFYAANQAEIREDLQYLSDRNGGKGVTDWKLGFWMYQALADPDAALAAYWADPDWQEGKGEESKVYTLNWLESLASMGTLDTATKADSPYAAVFVKNGIKSYVAFNPSGADAKVTFSDGKVLSIGAGDLATLDGAGALHTVDYANEDIPNRPDGIPLDLPTDPPQYGLTTVAKNGDLTLSVEAATGTAWITIGDAGPRALLGPNNVRATLALGDGVSAIGLGRDADGKMGLLGKTAAGEPYYPFQVSSTFHLGGNSSAVYNADYQKLEPWFGLDFNGDGIVLKGVVQTVAQNGTLKLLVDQGSGLAYLQDGTASMIGISRWAEDGLTQLTRGGWSLSAIGRDADGNLRVLDSQSGAGTSYSWKLDGKGVWTAETVYTDSNIGEAEAVFQQDLNGDGVIAPPLAQLVASNGDLKLLVDPSTGYALIQLEDGSRLTVTRDGWGDGVKIDRGSKLFAIGRDDQGRLRVLDGNPQDKGPDSNHWAWILDANGKFAGETVYDGKSLGDAEKIFGQDLNGDGVITGAPLKLIEKNGASSLYVDNATGNAYVSVQGADPILVTRDGWGDVQQQRGEWGLAAIAIDDQGRTRVLDASPFSDARYAWVLDANGHFSGEQSFNAGTVGDAETLFGLDLNGDGVTGRNPGASSRTALVG